MRHQTTPGSLPNYAGSVHWWYLNPRPTLTDFVANVGQTFNLNSTTQMFESYWPVNVPENKRTYADSLYNATDNTLLCNPVYGQEHVFSVRWQLNTTDPNLGPGLIGMYSVNGQQRASEPTVCRKGKLQIIYQTDFHVRADYDTIGTSTPGLWLRYIAGEDGLLVTPTITAIRRVSYAIDPTSNPTIIY